MEIKFSKEKPLIYEKCAKQFGVNWDTMDIIFTYGDTIHSKNTLTDDLFVHESTHVKQQTDMGKDNWWNKYFIDPVFRLEQEKEAYLNQWSFIKDNYNSKKRKLLKRHIIKSIITIYGDMITEDEANKLFI